MYNEEGDNLKGKREKERRTKNGEGRGKKL